MEESAKTFSEYFPEAKVLVQMIIAFIVTGAGGNFLAAKFQHRNWQHQHEVSLRKEEKEKAMIAFENWSSLMDRRLFRYRQIVYAFRSGDIKRIDDKFSDYVKILYEWNDNLNKNYALIENYFGKHERKFLETQIVSDFIFIGMLLERIKKKTPNAIGLEEVWEKIDQLNGKVYQFNLSLLAAIRSEKVGHFLEDVT